MKVGRAMDYIRKLEVPLNKYMFLDRIRNNEEQLYYEMLVRYLPELCPIVYTPTVGEACQHFGSVYFERTGMFFSVTDSGRMRSMLDNWTCTLTGKPSAAAAPRVHRRGRLKHRRRIVVIHRDGPRDDTHAHGRRELHARAEERMAHNRNGRARTHMLCTRGERCACRRRRRVFENKHRDVQRTLCSCSSR